MFGFLIEQKVIIYETFLTLNKASAKLKVIIRSNN